MGGAVVAQDWCTAMQNEANTNGHKWTPAFLGRMGNGI